MNYNIRKTKNDISYDSETHDLEKSPSKFSRKPISLHASSTRGIILRSSSPEIPQRLSHAIDSRRIVKIKKKAPSVVDTTVNYTCHCGKYFYARENILYILPCCHLVHETCFNKYLIQMQYENLNPVKNSHAEKTDLTCPFCKNNIKSILNEKKIKSKEIYNQYRIDMQSVKLDNSANINFMMLPLSIVKFTSLINKLILVNSTNDLFNTIEYMLRAFNFKINIIDNTDKNPIKFTNKIEWLNKKDNDEKMVIISNHTHNIDPIFINYLFRCGFIASEFVNGSDIGKLIVEKCNVLVFRRGVDTNMVEKIKKYLDEMKRIAIFPEGSMGNHKTLLNFRTGAFHTGAVICPIVIKYTPFIYDDDMKQMIFKLITHSEIVVDIYINDFFYPPFDDKKIEEIRKYMASVGNLELSRVSNKSVKE
jgi:1-acyl-sn-glycerol-3-phosphate acyltransferase